MIIVVYRRTGRSTLTKRKLIIESLSVLVSFVLIALGFFLSDNPLSGPQPQHIVILFGSAFFIGGFAKAKSGITRVIKNKSLNVSVLMIIAGLGAFYIGNYHEGAVLILIFSISGMLETYVSSKSDKALVSLLELAPKIALLIKDGVESEVPISQLKVGDYVVVKVGQRSPVDGVVTQGSTSLNQAAITGEFLPVSKTIDDDVFAGSINIESSIIVKTTTDPSKSVVQKIVVFVEQALKSKTKSQTFIDRFEKHYVHAIVFLAVAIMIFAPLLGILDAETAINRGIIVLVVGSPCALVASITPPMLSSLSNAARKGILIKGGYPLENINKVKAVVLDKTGTLTTGKPKVVHIESISSINKKELKSILHTIEKQSNHPLAKAISDSLADEKILSSIRTTEVSGKGMEATIAGDLWQVGKFDSKSTTDLKNKLDVWSKSGHSNVLIIKNRNLVGFVSLKDSIRKDAKSAILKLKTLKIRTVLLTGDNYYTAAAIAKQTGIDEFKADCLPNDKVDYIKKLQKTCGKVMMIGDGINDAPALAVSDISASMGSGSDISLETSDIIFMNNKLGNITKTITLGKRMRFNTLQNIIFSSTVILLLFISNIFGIIDLPSGVVAHETSTIIVILNSLRLLFR